MTGLWVMATAVATAVSFAGVQLVTTSVIRPVVPVVEHTNVTEPAATPASTTSTTVAGAGDPPVSRPVSTTANPPPTRPAGRAATFATEGGLVTVRCVGDAIHLVSATPRDGWRLEVRDTGPERVRVRFVGAERYVELFSVCVDGQPTRFSRNAERPVDAPRTTQPPRPPSDDNGPSDGDGDGRR